MPSRGKSICKKPGCTTLIPRPGYCDRHKIESPERKSFAELDKKKDPVHVKFYRSRKWTETSIRHRKRFPLCGRCRKEGRVVAGELVHHNPSLAFLLAAGENPYDPKFLETICKRHHRIEHWGK